MCFRKEYYTHITGKLVVMMLVLLVVLVLVYQVCQGIRFAPQNEKKNNFSRLMLLR
jgi:succinate dehydrogenase/fumarate reductase cytochrome b subunit